MMHDAWIVKVLVLSAVPAVVLRACAHVHLESTGERQREREREREQAAQAPDSAVAVPP